MLRARKGGSNPWRGFQRLTISLPQPAAAPHRLRSRCVPLLTAGSPTHILAPEIHAGASPLGIPSPLAIPSPFGDSLPTGDSLAGRSVVADRSVVANRSVIAGRSVRSLWASPFRCCLKTPMLETEGCRDHRTKDSRAVTRVTIRVVG